MHILAFSQYNAPVELISDYYNARLSPVWNRYRSSNSLYNLISSPTYKVNLVPESQISHENVRSFNHKYILPSITNFYNQNFFTCLCILFCSEIITDYPCEPLHTLRVLFSYIFFIFLWDIKKMFVNIFTSVAVRGHYDQITHWFRSYIH